MKAKDKLNMHQLIVYETTIIAAEKITSNTSNIKTTFVPPVNL